MGEIQWSFWDLLLEALLYLLSESRSKPKKSGSLNFLVISAMAVSLSLLLPWVFTLSWQPKAWPTICPCSAFLSLRPRQNNTRFWWQSKGLNEPGTCMWPPDGPANQEKRGDFIQACLFQTGSMPPIAVYSYKKCKSHTLFWFLEMHQERR